MEKIDTFEILNVQKLSPSAILPTRAHLNDAGLDLYCLETTLLEPGRSGLLSTGIAMAIPPHYFGLIADRSSHAKKGLKVFGGIIDPGYRGEIKVVLWNLSNSDVSLQAGDRIAQLLLMPVMTPVVKEVRELDCTERNQGGFGSSGR